MERRVKLKTINPHITCKICGGYFIDATTVTECLHTCEFCLCSLLFFFALIASNSLRVGEHEHEHLHRLPLPLPLAFAFTHSHVQLRLPAGR